MMLLLRASPLHLITAPLSNWRSAVNILSNQCHPSPSPQAAAINPSCSGMPGLTKMVALPQTSFYNGWVELPPSYSSTFKYECVLCCLSSAGWFKECRLVKGRALKCVAAILHKCTMHLSAFLFYFLPKLHVLLKDQKINTISVISTFFFLSFYWDDLTKTA